MSSPGGLDRGAQQSLAEATVPGGETAEHFHPESEELYYFVAGAGRMRLGSEEADVAAGDCVVIPPGTVHKLWNPATPISSCCAAAPRRTAMRTPFSPETEGAH